MEVSQHQLEALRNAVENRYGQTLNSPHDFMCLGERLQNEGAGSLSVSTIKRLWEYVPGYKTVYVSSLNVLSRYVGCRDWQEFCETLTEADTSDFSLGEVVALSTLKVGDEVEVRWRPGRHIVVKYLGQGRMRVIASERSKLAVGDTFSCSGMVNGEPLVLTQLEHANADQVLTYVCGKLGGITARKL